MSSYFYFLNKAMINYILFFYLNLKLKIQNLKLHHPPINIENKLIPVSDSKKPKDYIDIAISLSSYLTQSAVERDVKAGCPEEEVKQLRLSGLLPLVIPEQYGGIGATWVDAFKIVQELSKSDGSIGHLYGNHLMLTVLSHIWGTSAQKEKYYRETVQNNWFWANAINTRDTRLKITPDGDNFRVV